MLFSKDVEVASIDTEYDIGTEEPYYRVRFGKPVRVTPEIASKADSLKSLVGQIVVTASAEVHMSVTKPPPFLVGMKYRITVEDDGTVTIKAQS